MIEKLTNEQQALIPIVRDEWINRTLSDHYDREGVERGIKWLYRGAKLVEPRIVHLDSPLGCQIAANVWGQLDTETVHIGVVPHIVRSNVQNEVQSNVQNEVRGEVWDKVWKNVSDAARETVQRHIEAEVWDNVWADVKREVWENVLFVVGNNVWAVVSNRVGDTVSYKVGDNAWAEVKREVRNKVWENVRVNVRENVEGEVERETGNMNFTHYTPSWCSAMGDAGFMAWADYYFRSGIIKPEPGWLDYVEFGRANPSYLVLLKGVAFVSRGPKAVRRNEAGQLHSDQAPAIEWHDGYKMWCLDGSTYTHDVWEKIVTQTATMEDVQRIENADARAIAMRYLRPDRLLKACNAKLISTGVKGTRLYEVPNFMDTGRTEYLMLMTCPSTGREFVEGVHPDIGAQGDADLAQASAWVDEDGNPLCLEDYLTMVEA